MKHILPPTASNKAVLTALCRILHETPLKDGRTVANLIPEGEAMILLALERARDGLASSEELKSAHRRAVAYQESLIDDAADNYAPFAASQAVMRALGAANALGTPVAPAGYAIRCARSTAEAAAHFDAVTDVSDNSREAYLREYAEVLRKTFQLHAEIFRSCVEGYAEGGES